jgi:hypothetical protein
MSDKKGNEEENCLIAEFMGNLVDDESFNSPVVTEPSGNYYYLSECRYNSSWDALIPVAQKIKDWVYSTDMDLYTFKNAVGRWHPISNEIGNLKIEKAYYCIIKFITWYNSLNHDYPHIN